jgi:hypothetical protein
LKGFKQRAASTNTIEYKIGEIFDEVRNRMSSGYNMRDIIDQLDRLQFGSQHQKHELSDLYEVKIKNMGNAGRNGGEYYTPRPLIRAIIDIVQPKIGETVYDGAVGSAGFLCEAFEYMSKEADTTNKRKALQEKTFFGKEKKSLAYVIAVMNMILHGIDAPNIIHTNTLGEWLTHGAGQIGIVNYDAMTDEIPQGRLGAMILDESSMLKSHYGKWGQTCIRLGRGLKWKLAGTGTHVIRGPLMATKVRRVEGWTNVAAADDTIRAWYETAISTTPAVNDWFPVSPPEVVQTPVIVAGVRVTRFLISLELRQVR